MILLQFLSLLFIAGLCIRPKIFFRIGYIALLGIPIGSTNTIMEYIDVVTIGNVSINIIHIIVILLFLQAIYIFIKREPISIQIIMRKLKSIKGILIITAIFLIVLNLIIGFFRGYSFISDGQKYVMFITWLFTTFVAFKYQNYNFESFIQDTCIALSINFICIIIMNIFINNLNFLLIDNIEMLSQESGFVSYASNISLIPMIFCAYIFFSNYKKCTYKKHIIFCTIISFICNIIYASNRTFILILGISLFIVLWKSNYINNLNTKNKFLVLLSMMVGSVIIFLILYLSGNTLVTRLLNTNIFKLDQNIITRINTILYYVPLILISPFGYGFGRTIPLINQFGRFHGSSNFTDNAFINIGMKTGFVGLVLFLLMIIYAIHYLINEYKKTMNNYWITILVCLVSLLVSCGLMTGQIMNNYPVTFFFGVFIIAILRANDSNLSIMEIKL